MSVKAKLIPVLTEAGKQAVFKADTADINVKITHIAVGAGRYEPTADRTALEDEKLRVEILSSLVDKTNYQMTLNTIFKDEDLEFYINEFGVYLEDGTLFAVWSSPTKTLSYKSIWSKPIFAFTLKIVDVNLDAITIVDKGLDLKLNYLNEILGFGVSFLKINNLINALFAKIKKNREEVDTLLLSNAIANIRQMRVSIKERDKLKSYIDKRYRVTLANSNAIIKINQREVKNDTN